MNQDRNEAETRAALINPAINATGFGLGFERTILYATGMANIRDLIPFPRTPNSAEF